MRARVWLVAAGLAVLGAEGSAIPKISIFHHHVQTIAQQEKIPLLTAAQRVRAMGYEGLDVFWNIREEDMKLLMRAGLKPGTAIGFTNFEGGDNLGRMDSVIKFCTKWGFKRVMLVPGQFPKDCADKETMRKDIIRRTCDFVKLAKAEGIDVVIEDFDNPLSPTFDAKGLDQFLEADASIGHAFDTGNWDYCGADLLEMHGRYAKKIRHVHLKDRPAHRSNASVAVGTGVLPMKEVVERLAEGGYDGWWTVEQYGCKEMLPATVKSYEWLSTALAGAATPRRLLEIGDCDVYSGKVEAEGTGFRMAAEKAGYFNGAHIGTRKGFTTVPERACGKALQVSAEVGEIALGASVEVAVFRLAETDRVHRKGIWNEGGVPVALTLGWACASNGMTTVTLHQKEYTLIGSGEKVFTGYLRNSELPLRTTLTCDRGMYRLSFDKPVRTEGTSYSGTWNLRSPLWGKPLAAGVRVTNQYSALGSAAVKDVEARIVKGGL